MPTKMLDVKGVSKRFRGLLAVDNLSFCVEQAEVLGVIGPNGAGKSTIFNVITGVYRPDSGQVLLDGENITNLSPDQISKKRLGRTFQVTRPFGDMTVLQNVTTGAFLRTSKTKKAVESAEAMVEFVGLKDKRDAVARRLSIIDQRRLEFARALATEPKILLLDEVMAGLNASEVDEAIELVRKVKEMNITLVVVEHVMKVILSISDRILVLNQGKKLAEGKATDVMENQQVIEAYLGKGYAKHATH